MKSPEQYLSIFKKSMEDGLMHKKGSKKWPELLRGLGAEANDKKMAAVFSIIKELAPEALVKKLLNEDPSRLPFNPDQLEFKGRIDKGWEHMIYLLESKDEKIPSYVLKINLLNTGSAEELAEKAVEFKNEYKRLKDLYAAISGLVPEEFTMIAASPRGGQPSIATIQKFIGYEIKDLIEDYEIKELSVLFKNEPGLLADYQKFMEITEKEFNSSGRVIDLIGDKNLAIVKIGGEHKLIILDPHNSVSDNGKDDRIERQKEKMDKLGLILKAFKN